MDVFRTFLRVLRFARVERLIIISLILAASILASVQMAESVLFGRMIDALATDSSFLRYLIIWIAVGAVNVGVSIFLTIISDRLCHRHRMHTLDAAFEKSVATPISHYAQHGTGMAIRTILTGTDHIFWILIFFFMSNLTAVFGILIVVPLAFILQPLLAVLLMGLAVVYAAASVFIVRRTHIKQEKIERLRQDLSVRIVDVISNVFVVRSFNRAKEEAVLFRELTSGILREQYPVLNWWGAFNLITRLSSMVSMIAIVAVGSALVHKGLTSAGQIVTFVGFSTSLIARLDQLSLAFNRVVSNAPVLKNLFELLDGVHLDPNDRRGGIKFSVKPRGHVKFENVSFRYGTKEQGVFGLSFEANPGETVALVGPSGAGKTTTLSLLQRVLSPQSGRIHIDDIDVQELDVESLCGNIATVFQDPGLFNRSIHDNIEVGKPSASQAEIEMAARKADAHLFITERPNGYNFVVGERGVALSGGERQRIALARAILKDAPILILDEATSALDNESEKRVQAAMGEMRKGRTTFVIAHRLSTILTADHVLVFSQGRIVERGTFHELKKMNGLFARLLAAGEISDAHAEPIQLAQL